MYNILAMLITLGAPLNCDDANELLSLIRPFDPQRLEMVKVIVVHTDPVCFEDAKADWRNGLINLIPTGANQMAQVTYRGVQYDTNRAKSQQSNKVELVYRGVKLNKDLTTAK